MPVEFRDHHDAAPDRSSYARRSAYQEDPDVPGRSIYHQEPSFFSHFNLAAFMRERSVSALAWVIFTIQVCVMLMTLVIFAAPGWGYTLEIRGGSLREGYMYGYYGLWYACWTLSEPDPLALVHTDCELMADLPYVPGWFAACQGLGCVVFILCIACLAVHCFYVFSTRFNKNARVIGIVLYLNALSAAFYIILFIYFCVKFLNNAYWCCSGSTQILSWQLYYCFILACVITASQITLAICGGIEYRGLQRHKRQENYLQRVASTRRSGAPPNMNYGYKQ